VAFILISLSLCLETLIISSTTVINHTVSTVALFSDWSDWVVESVGSAVDNSLKNAYLFLSPYSVNARASFGLRYTAGASVNV